MTQAGQTHSVVKAVRRVPQWVGELGLVAVLYVAYEIGRGFHDGSRSTADHTGRTLLHWEQVLHIDPERWLTDGLNRIAVLAVPATYFYATLHYIITPAVLIWLYVKHHEAYGPSRTWLACSTLLGLITFYLVPTTPPRLLGLGYPDVMDHYSSYGWWGAAGSAPKGLGHLTDQLAAMPSLHFGWSLFCGIMIYRYARRRWVRALGVAYPLLTAIVVLSTGNHYLLDVVAGALVMFLGWAMSQGLYRGGHRLHSVLTRRHEERELAAVTQAAAAPSATVPMDDAPPPRGALATTATARATPPAEAMGEATCAEPGHH